MAADHGDVGVVGVFLEEGGELGDDEEDDVVKEVGHGGMWGGLFL